MPDRQRAVARGGAHACPWKDRSPGAAEFLWALPGRGRHAGRCVAAGAGGAAARVGLGSGGRGAGTCAQICAHLPSAAAGFGSCCRDMKGRRFITRVSEWATNLNLRVRFVASAGAGPHGTLYAGERRTTIKDCRKETGRGLLNRMLADLGIDRDGFQGTERRQCRGAAQDRMHARHLQRRCRCRT